jgi:SAM-dependent methyltransferase
MNMGHLEFLASDAWAQLLATELVPWMDSLGELGPDVLEVGPGPGLTTEIIRSRSERVTAIESDPELAAALRERLGSTNVDVVLGDARVTALPADRFSAAVCFSMLHHVPSAQKQDAVLAELCRLLRRGGRLIGTDSLDIEALRDFHADDVFVPMDPVTLPARLAVAGFTGVVVEVRDYEMRFTATKP